MNASASMLLAPGNPAPCPVTQARIRATLEQALARAEASDDAWIFGYASLIWRPEFEAVESREARLLGWHRALRMTSRVNRGTPERPGLVFALFHGGTCRGVVYRLDPRTRRDDLVRLWSREMPLATYEPRWLPCRTARGTVSALTFTLHRRHPSHAGRLADDAMLDVLRHAHGRYGSTLDYLLATSRGLRDVGIVDPEIERLVRLATKAGLVKEHARLDSTHPRAGSDATSPSPDVSPQAGLRAASTA